MKTKPKPLSEEQFMKLAQKAAYEKYYTLEGIGKTSGIFSKTDDSYIKADWSDLRPWIDRGVSEQFQARNKQSGVSQIAYNPKIKAWYGWSHRAIAGFKIGHKVKKDEFDIYEGISKESLYYKEHAKLMENHPVGYIAKNLEDCKQLAILFANSVS